MPRLNRCNKKNGTRFKTKPGYTYRVYCPECPPVNLAHPEQNISIPVDGTNPPRHVKCRNGHITETAR